MLIDKHNAWDIICQCVGQRISSFYRVYDHNALSGETQEENDSELQINFANGQILVLEGGIAGQALKVEQIAWQDPFAGRDEAFQVFLQEYKGWWVKLVDVSGREYYRDIVGQPIQAAYPIKTDNHWLSGVQFALADLRLSFTFSADSCEVWWGSDHAQDFAERFLVVDYEYSCKASDLAQE